MPIIIMWPAMSNGMGMGMCMPMGIGMPIIGTMGMPIGMGPILAGPGCWCC